jgi:membrane protein
VTRRRGSARRIAGRTIAGAWNHDIFSESAAAAFWQTLSFPPLLLGLFGLLGYIGPVFGPDTVTEVQRWILGLASGVFSRSAVDQIIGPTVEQILTTARTEVASLGFLISLWSGSSAMSSFVDAITKAFAQYERRNLVWQRLLAVLLYLVGLVTGIVALPIAALGSRLLPLLPDAVEPFATQLYGTFYYPVIGGVLVLALTTLYRIALPFKPPWWRGLPGAVLAAVVFLAGVTGVRLYLDWITSTGYTYGALAAPIAFLLAAFLIAIAIVLGAHLNAAIQVEWPARLRRRGATVTDPLAPATSPPEALAKPDGAADRDRTAGPDGHAAARAARERSAQGPGVRAVTRPPGPARDRAPNVSTPEGTGGRSRPSASS